LKSRLLENRVPQEGAIQKSPGGEHCLDPWRLVLKQIGGRDGDDAMAAAQAWPVGMFNGQPRSRLGRARFARIGSQLPNGSSKRPWAILGSVRGARWIDLASLEIAFAAIRDRNTGQ
jgi:hypothetical protein